LQISSKKQKKNLLKNSNYKQNIYTCCIKEE